MKTFYHFTTENRLSSIRQHGLCIGDTVIDLRKGINAVNLTEESHFHDPSRNNLTSGVDAKYRITVRLSLNDMRLRSMVSMGKVYPKMKRFHKDAHPGSAHGNYKKHWKRQTKDKFHANRTQFGFWRFRLKAGPSYTVRYRPGLFDRGDE